MFYLTAINGPQQGRRYEIARDRYVLGRHPECEIVVEVGAVSRQHAVVIREGNQCFVEDMNSRNGTFVNGEPEKIAGRRLLKAGDQIRICDVTFSFGDENLPPPVATRLAVDKALPALLVDDNENTGSTVMSKLDVSSSGRGVHVAASAEVKLAALVEITQSLGRALSLDDVLPNVLKALFRIFVQADRGFIVLKEPDGKLVPRWTRVRRDDQGDTIRISRTIIKTVMESKQAILSADAASDERFELSQSIADFRIRSMMCAPLLDTSGEAIGALQIDTLDQRQRFQPEDLELLVSTASQAAIAIQNAQLHDQSLRQREIERDMILARDVQKGFLPDRRPELPSYAFFDFYQPADQVGGDYFDYITMPDGKVAVVVADVVGHGVSAALLMAKLSAETKFCLYSEANPAIAVTKLNERLCATGLSRFVTMIMVVIDPKEHKAYIVNAGHMAPLHRRGDLVDEPGTEVGGIPLGITDSISYEMAETQIEPGDVLTLYTDGINESMNATGAFYGIDRLRQLVLNKSQPEELGKTIIDDVRSFIGRSPQVDDMCLVCVGRLA